jgi:hypothetical protein
MQAMINSQLAEGRPIPWLYDDGGRGDAGYRGLTGDCATRAVAIVSGMSYQDVYDMINEYAKQERPRASRRSNARLGVHAALMHRMLVRDLGWTWTPAMAIGSGTKVHVRRDELPGGRLIVRCSKHYAAVIDGVLHDIYDSSRDGKRAVYGYWQPA